MSICALIFLSWAWVRVRGYHTTLHVSTAPTTTICICIKCNTKLLINMWQDGIKRQDKIGLDWTTRCVAFDVFVFRIFYCHTIWLGWNEWLNFCSAVTYYIIAICERINMHTHANRKDMDRVPQKKTSNFH